MVDSVLTVKKLNHSMNQMQAKLPWGDLDDVALECTGFYTDKDKAQAHIDAGAKKY